MVHISGDTNAQNQVFVLLEKKDIMKILSSEILSQDPPNNKGKPNDVQNITARHVGIPVQPFHQTCWWLLWYL